MSKDLLEQIPAEERPVAAQLRAAVKDMRLSPAFEWQLETQLMEKYQSSVQPAGPSWTHRVLPALGWTVAAVVAVFLLTWVIRPSRPQNQPAAAVSPAAPTPPNFESRVRQGLACAGHLALTHDFAVSLTTADKTQFEILDPQNGIGELRAATWSPDGQRLAVLGNTAGGGNIYLTDQPGLLTPILPSGQVGYVNGLAWSRDGQRLVAWSTPSHLYIVDADGSHFVDLPLQAQIFGTPQFVPDGQSVIFFGADGSGADGLLEAQLDGSDPRLLTDRVEAESAFAFSPDGSRLAYFEVDRVAGTARLMLQDWASQATSTQLSELPIPKGSGSSIPQAAHLSWSADGQHLIFDFGRSAPDRTIYLSSLDGSNPLKLVEAAYAPTLSPDGRCLAYISNKQIHLLDLADPSRAAQPLVLAALPAGRSMAGYPLDQLQWQP